MTKHVMSYLPSFFLGLEDVLVFVLSLPSPLLLPFAIPVLAALGVASLVEEIALATADHKLIVMSLVLALVAIRRKLRVSTQVVKKQKVL